LSKFRKSKLRKKNLNKYMKKMNKRYIFTPCSSGKSLYELTFAIAKNIILKVIVSYRRVVVSGNDL